jgi:hypothetical protein
MLPLLWAPGGPDHDRATLVDQKARQTNNALRMKAKLHWTATLVTLLAVLLGPLLPPAHRHRSAGFAHIRILVHRHFAPHRSAAGTHMERPGVAEGAPEWLDDPHGSLPHLLLVAEDTTVFLFNTLSPPKVPARNVTFSSEASRHGPPRPLIALRAPPFHS